MVETISLRNVGFDSKVALLKALDYDTDGKYVLDSNGNKILDKYLEEPVLVENMLILPGSTIILDDNPLSIALYMEEYPDVFWGKSYCWSNRSGIEL